VCDYKLKYRHIFVVPRDNIRKCSE
jgi:hypothetical protein